MRRFLRLGLFLILAAAGGAAWYWLRPAPPPANLWQGYAEADYVKVGPTQAGLLTAMLVNRGDEVAQGAPLFTQDAIADTAARDQAARQYAQAQDVLANLLSGGKPTEIRTAEANLADARASLLRIQTDLQRGESLLRTGVASRQNVDQLRADAASAQARVQVMEAALAQVQAPLGRDAEISAQRAAVEASRAALEMAQWRLDQRRVTAPAAARVADVLARPGETIAAGMPVVSLLPPANILVRFFVPETVLGRLHRGDALNVRCDSCAPGLTATISFIAPQPEYTPPVIYSETSRSKLVWMIEARPGPDQAARLNPGQPLQVSLRP